MFKVCGVTFDHTTNYGSCFQAYALQTAIEKLNVEGEVCLYDLLPYSTFRVRNPAENNNGFLERIKRTVKKSLMKWRRAQFSKFEKKYMHYAECKSIEALPDLNQKYDAFVCGSDVIWNIDFTHGDGVYWLSFAKKYKFSYAASFGVKNIETDYSWDKERVYALFQNLLPTLNSISVREKSAVAVARNFTERDIEVVCDPVLLLTRQDWMKICDKFYTEKRTNREFIFVYSTYISPNLLSFVKQLKSQTGLDVIHVTWDEKEAIKRGILSFPEPEKWLYLLKNASYVVTNSFHGCAFCSLFHKTFFAVMRDERVIGTRIRLYDFLDELGLRSRLFGSTPQKIDTTPPDFSASDMKISEMRNASLSFLQKNLIKAYEDRME